MFRINIINIYLFALTLKMKKHLVLAVNVCFHLVTRFTLYSSTCLQNTRFFATCHAPSSAFFAEIDEICFTFHVACAGREHTERRRENFITFRADLKLYKLLYYTVFVSSICEVWKYTNFCSEIWPHMTSNYVKKLISN